MSEESRNLISPEVAEYNRTKGKGGYTFNLLPPEDYEGIMFVIACLRLGDHAHVEVSTGRQVRAPLKPTWHYGRSGYLILRWPEWIALRGILEHDERMRIAEVENPTKGQLDFHLPKNRRADVGGAVESPTL